MGGSPVLTYYDMSPEVVAFSTTRHGGCSRGAYGEMNVNPWCGDDPADVAANRMLLCRELGIGVHRLVIPHQTHGTGILRVTEAFVDETSGCQMATLEGIDAVMTDVSGVCIGVSTADCIPVLLYDTEHRACCAVHAGWRGTVGRIAEKAVESMRWQFGTDADRLRAVIGPGISLDSFEVGDEVYRAFLDEGFDMENISRRYDKWHIDLWACNRLQLENAGVPRQCISVAGVCTYLHPDEYFSARRLGTASGRILTGIMINDNQ